MQRARVGKSLRFRMRPIMWAAWRVWMCRREAKRFGKALAFGVFHHSADDGQRFSFMAPFFGCNHCQEWLIGSKIQVANPKSAGLLLDILGYQRCPPQADDEPGLLSTWVQRATN